MHLWTSSVFIEELIAIETSTYRTQATWYSSVCLSAAGLLITAPLGSVNSIISHLISKGDLIDSLEPMTHVQDERLSVCVLFECASAAGDTLRPTLRSILHSYPKPLMWAQVNLRVSEITKLGLVLGNDTHLLIPNKWCRFCEALEWQISVKCLRMKECVSRNLKLSPRSLSLSLYIYHK